MEEKRKQKLEEEKVRDRERAGLHVTEGPPEENLGKGSSFTPFVLMTELSPSTQNHLDPG